MSPLGALQKKKKKKTQANRGKNGAGNRMR